MVSEKQVEEQIARNLRLHSGLEAKRGYLGMSQVARCPREAYRAFVKGIDLSDQSHRMCYAGYLHERDVLDRLRAINFAVLDRREIVAPFDQRLRGHIDGVTHDGDLLEIKSLANGPFYGVKNRGEVLWRHNDQVQLYMRYGGWRAAWVVYVCRETLEHKVLRVPCDQEHGNRMELKAIKILQAIDAGVEPACECGKCRKEAV